jgi:DNA-directed RNA polymerase subunit RPC12/RpoP
MKPVGWSKRSVQLECESCGSHMRLALLPYLATAKNGRQIACETCGVQSAPTVARRVPLHA